MSDKCLQEDSSSHNPGIGSVSIDDLPPEILGLIFMLVHQDLGKGALFKGLGALFMTCKDWNQLALSIPELWSSIEVLVGDQAAILHSQHLTTITTWLERSRNAPLSLTLDFESLQSPILDHTNMFGEAALRPLLDNFGRWRSISFNFGHVFFDPPPIPGQVVAPFLEHIDIKFYSPSLRGPGYYTALVAAAPGLRSYFVYPYSIVPFNIPWEQLHRFYCSRPVKPEEALIFLDLAKALQECHFVMLKEGDLPRFEDSGLSKPPRVTSTIQSMSVGGIRPHDFQVFLSRLDTPNLNTLNFYFPHRLEHPFTGDAQYAILSLSLQGSFQLSSLTIENLGMDENEFINCLLVSPSLATLSIQTKGDIDPRLGAPEAITNKVLKFLTYGNTNLKPACPNLESLTLERCVDAGDGVLSNMVRSRRWSSRTAVDRPALGDLAMLRHLDVIFTSGTHLVDQKRLNEFYQEGLRGVVRFTPPTRRDE